MLFLKQRARFIEMSKTACKKDDYREPENPKYFCKKCDRKAKKEDKLCKPKKIKN